MRSPTAAAAPGSSAAASREAVERRLVERRRQSVRGCVLAPGGVGRDFRVGGRPRGDRRLLVCTDGLGLQRRGDSERIDRRGDRVNRGQRIELSVERRAAPVDLGDASVVSLDLRFERRDPVSQLGDPSRAACLARRRADVLGSILAAPTG